MTPQIFISPSQPTGGHNGSSRALLQHGDVLQSLLGVWQLWQIQHLWSAGPFVDLDHLLDEIDMIHFLALVGAFANLDGLFALLIADDDDVIDVGLGGLARNLDLLLVGPLHPHRER